MTEPRFDSILAQVKLRYSSIQVGIALVEGLPALARIALTARIARRTVRFVTFQVESAREIVEGAIGAAEKASSGESMSAGEDLAAQDAAVLHACALEEVAGNEAAARAGQVARKTARCVSGPELAFGENASLAHIDLERLFTRTCRDRGMAASEIKGAIDDEMRGVYADLQRLILYAEAYGERWLDPDLAGPLDRRNDRGWTSMLETAGISRAARGSENRERWQRIHQEVRKAGGYFYPPGLFARL